MNTSRENLTERVYFAEQAPRGIKTLQQVTSAEGYTKGILSKTEDSLIISNSEGVVLFEAKYPSIKEVRTVGASLVLVYRKDLNKKNINIYIDGADGPQTMKRNLLSASSPAYLVYKHAKEGETFESTRETNRWRDERMPMWVAHLQGKGVRVKDNNKLLLVVISVIMVCVFVAAIASTLYRSDNDFGVGPTVTAFVMVALILFFVTRFILKAK